MEDGQSLPERHRRQLHRARARLGLAEEVGLALRADRRRLRLSQRAYADSRGMSRAMIARLEAGAGRLSLDTITSALLGTGFRLSLTFDDQPPTTPGADLTAVPDRRSSQDDVGWPPTTAAIAPDAWQPTDLVARVRGGSRRFPAHRRVYAVTSPPLWWWIQEFFDGPTEEPQWYAPVPISDLTLCRDPEPDDPEPDAA